MLSADEAAGYPFRVAGTRLCALFGRDLKQATFPALFSAETRRQIEDIVSIVAADMLPAVAQGVIAIVGRTGDAALQALAQVNHLPTEQAAAAERAFLAGLGGDCGTPIAGYARVVDAGLVLEGALFSLDGTESVRGRLDGPAAGAADLGQRHRARPGPPV